MAAQAAFRRHPGSAARAKSGQNGSKGGEFLQNGLERPEDCPVLPRDCMPTPHIPGTVVDLLSSKVKGAQQWVTDGGSALNGVRPSPGAATLESNGDAVKPGASGSSVLAAPDGRTPPRPSPAITDRLQQVSFFPCASWRSGKGTRETRLASRCREVFNQGRA